MIFGGYVGLHPHRPRLARSQAVTPTIWAGGHAPGYTARTAVTRRCRVTILGPCSATVAEVADMAERGVPADAAWRWAGAYAIVEESPDGDVVLHTDPASARPLYAARSHDGWVWSSSARALAGLLGSGLDVDRLACAIVAPGVPTLTEGSTCYVGVGQLPAGARVHLSADGGPLRTAVVWRPTPWQADLAGRLRERLLEAVALRARISDHLSCDLSGGLDSTSVAVAAAEVLPPGRILDAVTVHPAGDHTGADLRYARLTAAAHPGRIAHRLLPLTARELPYTHLHEVPVSDEPAPSTIAHARYLRQMQWMREEFDAAVHMTGDGGDSILFVPPVHLADLIRRRRVRRAVSEAFGWARLRRVAAYPLLAGAVRAARTPRAMALHRFAQTLLTPAPPHAEMRGGDVAWFPALPVPGWASEQARYAASAAAHLAACRTDPLADLDAAARVLVDEVREVARTAAADAELAATTRIDLHNPLLDAAVVDAVLAVAADQRPPVFAYKPVLIAAMDGLLPPEVAARTTKGSFDGDHYAGMRVNLPALFELISDGRLAAAGLLDLAAFRAALRQCAAGIPLPFAAIEPALAAEAWARAHNRAPAHAWTTGGKPEGDR